MNSEQLTERITAEHAAAKEPPKTFHRKECECGAVLQASTHEALAEMQEAHNATVHGRIPDNAATILKTLVMKMGTMEVGYIVTEEDVEIFKKAFLDMLGPVPGEKESKRTAPAEPAPDAEPAPETKEPETEAEPAPDAEETEESNEPEKKKKHHKR